MSYLDCHHIEKLILETMSGTALISIAPYGMASLELKELKKQLEELLEEGFIRILFHLGKHQYYLFKKKGWKHETMY